MQVEPWKPRDPDCDPVPIAARCGQRYRSDVAMLLALLLQTTAAPPPDAPAMPLGHHGGMVPVTCPVGGEKFEAWRSGTYSSYGARPDGKPYSYMPFPFPLPECPSNRLVIFDDYTPAEIATLTPLIATPDLSRADRT